MATQTITNQNIFAAKQSTTTPSPPTLRIRGYKDFLTPALHRRFTATAGIVLLVCLFEAWQLSTSGGLLRSWFPIGPAGARALLLSISCLAVFIVRVANMHIGRNIAPSAARETYNKLRGGKLLTTAVWYVFSAWWFGEVYIWSRSESAELGMVDPGRPYERPRMNENPLFLRSLFVVTGIIQVVLHLLRDYDQVRMLPEQEEKHIAKSVLVRYTGLSPTTVARLPRPFRVLFLQFGSIVTRAGNGMIFGCLANPFVYFTLVRHRLWHYTYAFARTWFHDLPEDAAPTGLLHFPKLLAQMGTATFMLMFLWEISNTIFSTSVAQPPLKKEHPLTSEIKDARGVILHKSADPNGSLLTGLKAKKEINKAFAFWELAMIAEKFDTRRRTIYTEVDRADGTTWKQICELALKEISGVADRIKTANAGPEFTMKMQEAEARKEHHQHLIGYEPEEATGLKKIADRTVYDNADVFAKQKPDFVNYVNNFAKSIGSSPNSQDPVSPRAKKYLNWAADETLTAQQRQYLSSDYIQREASGILGQFLRTPAGEPFRRTFARSIASIVLGSPTSNQANIIHAASALAKLCVCSLKEDNFGQVQKDVAKIIRTLTQSIKDAEKLIREFKPSWTDVTFNEMVDRQIYDPWTLQAVEDPDAVEDVQLRFVQTGRIARFTQEKKEFTQVMNALKGSLEDIILAFEEYASALGLTKKDVREAKEAIQRPAPPPVARRPQPGPSSFPQRPEMEEAGRPRERRIR